MLFRCQTCVSTPETQQAKKLKSHEMMEGWMKNDEGWMKNDEGWRLNDEGWWFLAVEGFWFMTDKQTDKQTNKRTFVNVELLLWLNKIEDL